MKVGLFINRVTDYTRPVLKNLSDAVDLRIYLFDGDLPDTLAGRTFSARSISGYGLTDAPLALMKSHDVVILAGLNYFTTHVGALTSRLTDTPVIVWSDEWAATQRTTRHTLLRPIKRAVISRSDGFVACGSPQARFLRQLGSDPNRISIARYSPCTIPEPSEWKPPSGIDATDLDQPILLYFGRLIPRKGVDTVIDAFEITQQSNDTDFELVVAGQGPMAGSVADRCASIEGAFALTEYVTHAEKAWLLANAHVTCLPASAEPWGIVITESLSVDTPVIASTEVAAALDHVDEGQNGALVPPRDKYALVDVFESGLDFNCSASPAVDVNKCTPSAQAERILEQVESVVK